MLTGLRPSGAVSGVPGRVTPTATTPESSKFVSRRRDRREEERKEKVKEITCGKVLQSDLEVGNALLA
jgi:hypothetical protein